MIIDSENQRRFESRGAGWYNVFVLNPDGDAYVMDRAVKVPAGLRGKRLLRALDQEIKILELEEAENGTQA